MMKSEDIRADLLGLALEGNERMLNTLLGQYRPQLYAVALNICGYVPAAEDAVQEAMLIAYTKLNQLKDPAAFLPWLKKIVSNCCYQALRKNKLELTDATGPGMEGQIEASIEKHYDDMTMRDALYTSLSRLPDVLRSTMVLRYLSDYNSYEQVAAILGIPVGTVRSRLSEGRKQLLQQWNDHQYADSVEYERSQYWNDFYSEVFSGMYDDKNYLNVLKDHIKDDLELVFTSGKSAKGRNVFISGLYDDFEHGSRLSAVNSCITSGDLTIAHVSFANSPEHPTHCPPGSFVTMYRKKGKMTRIRLYHPLHLKTIVTRENA
ncbi:RNA polymerase sigma factor [Chitinophaga sp. S165]|uniref:RNA polymerase sigma factor n=1 Tax=Chitinophaga sp. S165 TaxID=2135462 RepID=UPI000D71A491|nr:RNA polymerase sigma factor [Chitinophaga sp. S165]PWV49604.1 RNA polymerase sigma-70 factor (ECF subfamily) [Chitinophaga sp. S165]